MVVFREGVELVARQTVVLEDCHGEFWVGEAGCYGDEGLEGCGEVS